MPAALDHRSPVLEKLAELYATSTAGTTGIAARDFGEPYPRLLKRAGSASGAPFALAEMDLQHARRAGAVVIDEDRRSHAWQRIRVPLASEPALFALLGRPSPSAEREAWAAMFEDFAARPVPAARKQAWEQFCRSRAAGARAGAGLQPFRFSQRKRAAAQLDAVEKLLAWTRPCLLRTASQQGADAIALLVDRPGRRARVSSPDSP